MDTGNESNDVQKKGPDTPQAEATAAEETGARETRDEHTGAEHLEDEHTEDTGTDRTDTDRTDAGPAAQPKPAPTAWGYPPQESAAEPPRGPAVAPILLGVLVLATAAFALADQALDLSVDWGQVGPVGILLGGGVLVLLGLLGMRRRPR